MEKNASRLFKELFQGGRDQEAGQGEVGLELVFSGPRDILEKTELCGNPRSIPRLRRNECLLLTLVSVQLSVMVWLASPQDSGLGIIYAIF